MTTRVALVVGVALLAGCVFRNPTAPRFFAPVSALADDADDRPGDPGPGMPVRLASVHGTSFLRDRIVWRVSPVEYGHYDQRLWRELPASYVERALATALRRAPGIQLTDDSRAAVLHVEVLAFDEILAPEHAATVTLAAMLRDPKRGRLLDRTFSANAPIANDDPATMAAAMGRALDEASAAVVDGVQRTAPPSAARVTRRRPRGSP